MDNRDLSAGEVKDVPKEGHSQVQGVLRREVDSLDDFEHLGHDTSPLQERGTGDLTAGPPARDELGGAINTGVGVPANAAATKITDLSSFDPLRQPSPFDKAETAMDSNLLDLGDSFPDRKEADAKLDKFLQEMTFVPQPPKHQEAPEIKDKDVDFKTATQNFVDVERGPVEPKKPAAGFDQLERYSDSEPDDDEDYFKPTNYQDFPPKKADPPASFGPADRFKSEAFKDVKEFEPELPKKEPSPEPEKVVPSAPLPAPEVVRQKTPEPVKEKTPPPQPQPEPVKDFKEKVAEKAPEPAKKVPEKTPEPEPVKDVCKKPETVEAKTKKATVIDAEAIFCRMGLDAWFNPERLNPRVESLIYWRDPKKSGPVFGGVLLILLALTYFSLISVVAYLSLIGLTGTISFRIYKNIVQAVQKTGDGHPFKELLEFDVSLPHDKVKEVSEVVVAHINAGVVELRRLFLVEDLVDSIKFGVLLWTLTYLGAWFNGMTLIIIAWVALFTLPKVYEANKTQIDANLEIVRSKLADITSKVKAAIPIGKKAVEEKKEQ